FTVEERIQFIEKSFEGASKIEVKSYSGLTAKFCISENSQFIVRGLRNTTDLNYEQPIAQTNYKLAGVESIFLICSPEVSNISSTVVRDIMRNDGAFSILVPASVKRKYFIKRTSNKKPFQFPERAFKLFLKR